MMARISATVLLLAATIVVLAIQVQYRTWRDDQNPAPKPASDDASVGAQIVNGIGDLVVHIAIRIVSTQKARRPLHNYRRGRRS